MPPVEVPAARFPRESSATAPTVSWLASPCDATPEEDSEAGVKRGFRTLVVAKNLSGEGFVGQARSLPQLRLDKPFAFTIENQLMVVDQSHAMSCREGFGAGSDEVNMRTSLENEARGLDGIEQAFHTCDPSGLHSSSIHEESIELHLPIGRKKASSPGVEGRIIFQNHDCCLDRVKRGASAGEDRVPGVKRFANAGLVRMRF